MKYIPFSDEFISNLPSSSDLIIIMNNPKDQYPQMTARPLIQNQLVQQKPILEPAKLPPPPPPPPQAYYQANQVYPPNYNYQMPPPMPNPYNNYGVRPQVVVIQNGLPLPGGVICPYCMRETQTLIRHVPGTVTWLWCIFMTFFTGFCCIPFCIDSCQDVVMICMNCQQVKARQLANCC